MAKRTSAAEVNAKDRTRLLSGNEAIARGAWEAGVHVAAAYPGTPSTEILEHLAGYPEVDCEWATNEKVALEVAVGASVAGGRALAAMKHVGLNVAADPLFSVAYMGVRGGLVIVSADDPGMHSSQNEQDNRLMARAARVALLEPSSSQEAKDYAHAAFELSEKYDIPVVLRTTTRISHGTGRVQLGERREAPRKPYAKDPAKYVVLPAHGRVRHRQLEMERLPALGREAECWAQVFEGSDELGIITAGAAFPYAREAFPEASILKLGLTHPLPCELIKEFSRGKKHVFVIEELEPYLEEQVRALGVDCEGKGRLPRVGELSVGALKRAFLGGDGPPVQRPALPPRPPVLCPGCGHRGVFYVLKELDAIVSGDIGCYTLGALPPLGAMDTCMNMGASIGMAHGMAKVMSEEERRRLVAVIGDSTFYHSGITGLVDILYNGGHSTVIVLDNHTTAMTGHQGHPGSGRDVRGEPARIVDLEALCRGLGVEHVRRVDPYDLDEIRRVIGEALDREALSVVIADAPCVLMERTEFDEPVRLDWDRCSQCFACTQLGCPAIVLKNRHLEIDPLLCIACTHCQRVCVDCHAGIDIPHILELVHAERYAEAFEVLMRTNPLPAVAGRVCPHPCDHETNALGWPQERTWAERYPDLVHKFPASDRPAKLSVREVERFLGTYGLEHYTGAEFAPAVERDGRVAVVGAGPAGLSCAYQLRRRGFQITVFERSERPGGMLRYGIPEFRLLREVLQGEIDRLLMMGVEIRCRVEVGRDLSLDDLANDYDAVVIAVGDSAAQELDLEGTGEVREGLHYGIEFLRRFNRDQEVRIGRRVAVIGGGNTAIDCARAARRLGADVTVYYRRTEGEMPAIRDELDEATAEDVRFKFLVSPCRVLTEDRRVKALELMRMEPGLPDESGRRRPVPVPDSGFQVSVDTVILAVGERSDLEFLKASGVSCDDKIHVDFTGATERPGMFACGDVAFGHGTVTQGIATGRRAAEAVARYLDRKRR